MLAGELYDAGDPELLAARTESARLMRSVDEQPGGPARTGVLRQLLAALGDGSDIRSPFFCDYGFNISIGTGVFVNYNCVFLDVARITIGDRVQIGPAVQLLSADHPLDPEVRARGLENGSPIVIEDDAWLGGGAIVCPGVTIGRGSVIGAGSVVTRDVPAGVLAVGNPCRVLRELP
jgi:maltose O-acetyltransferase